MIERSAIVEEARTWLGTPFHHQASVKGVGCDCIGLLHGVASVFKLPGYERWKLDARRFSYGPMPQPDMLRKAVAEYLGPPQARVQMADVLLMTFQREPMHFAIVTEANSGTPVRIIHGYQVIGSVVENGVDVKWSRRIVAAYQLPGVGREWLV